MKLILTKSLQVHRKIIGVNFFCFLYGFASACFSANTSFMHLQCDVHGSISYIPNRNKETSQLSGRVNLILTLENSKLFSVVIQGPNHMYFTGGVGKWSVDFPVGFDLSNEMEFSYESTGNVSGGAIQHKFLINRRSLEIQVEKIFVTNNAMSTISYNGNCNLLGDKKI